VVQAVHVTPGAISYVEISPATGAGLPFAWIDNGSGAAELTDGNVGKAISAAKLGDGNDLVVDLASVYTSKAAGSYPLVMVTYEIVCSNGYDSATAAAVRSFLTVAADQGQKELSSIGYVPLPSDLQKRLQTAVDAIK
jgi:phosphate transport system substrate-binding protein